MIKHGTRKHALLNASGASRWINCTPSARMEDDFQEEASSVFAEEGTLAHEFGDLNLKIKTYVGPVGKGSQKEAYFQELEALRGHVLYFPEMEDFVEIYTDYVLTEYAAAKKKTADAVITIEERTDFSYLVPEGFGTSDANIIADNTLEIIDLKFGKGLKVEAVKNAQLRLYALGLLRKFDLVYDIKLVKMTIVQPRLDHIDSELLTVEDLVAWAEEVVRPAAGAAYEGKGTCNPGDWCEWCKAKSVCRALADKNLELAKMDFADAKTLTDEEVLKVYEQSSLLVDWANAVSSYMLKEALAGKAWDGYKLVEGRSNRKWLNEEEAIKRILDFNDSIAEDQVTNTKIKGIGDVEKLLGKGNLEKLGLVVKPQGAPTLAPESDKRPALGIASAKKDFE